LWADPSLSSAPSLEGAWYPAPDPAGYRNFVARYRKRFNQDPVPTATLAYDGVALVSALAKTHGAQRFSEETLTAASGFAGVEGVFRFRSDGSNERGLAVMRVTSSGGQPIAPAPRSFASAT
jgi:ABC-type branched-subunit amino acid transport system substrate-binding protein